MHFRCTALNFDKRIHPVTTIAVRIENVPSLQHFSHVLLQSFILTPWDVGSVPYHCWWFCLSWNWTCVVTTVTFLGLYIYLEWLAFLMEIVLTWLSFCHVLDSAYQSDSESGENFITRFHRWNVYYLST